ncbi:TIM barrel protein [Streptomyces sp. AS02]|uniref:sugar phosphate isomerase/epimerase family protein n=1 Tax=Streptomyces sp. AS02 TaxID=2938946 RepID=UPI002020B927|nr:TIM barrel protein [Streptomyces sp. AS02]MCL8014895.1 sugar phosphate isomerase/epimerase [Streptomyces sp. AS02]
MNRRTLLASASAASLAAVALPSTATAAATAPCPTRQPHLTWTIFSRHLQWLTTQSYAAQKPYETGVLIGEAAARTGYGAVDLTVRPGGHVEPAGAATLLPAMVRGVRSAGVRCDHITTGIADLTSDNAETVLRAAAASDIRRYRFGTFSYDTAADPAPYGAALLRQLDALRPAVRELARRNKKLGLTAIYHTFSGTRVGSSVWDLLYLFDGIDPDQVALNFDIGHLTADGAAGSWQIALRRAMPSLRGAGLKDVLIERSSAGRVSTVWSQAGTGLVQWQTFFGLLLEGGYAGPVEAQFEYAYNGVSLNQTWWADSPSFTLTPDQMLSVMTAELRTYKEQAALAGWTAAQQT